MGIEREYAVARGVIASLVWIGLALHSSVVANEAGDSKPNDGYRGYQRHRATSDAAYGTQPGYGYWSHLPHYGQPSYGYYPPRQRQPTDGGWFQRPYPYHLDYYKMRYQGSYEPYHGNLYGPPTYIVPAPSYGGGYYPNGFLR